MILRELCALRGVSGGEDAVRDYLAQSARAHADDVTIDRMGNLIACVRGSAPTADTVLLSAHMDEIGLIVLGADDDGLLAVSPIGPVDARAVISKSVSVGPNGVPGVIGAKAIHLQSEADRTRALKFDEIFIDIGAHDAESALKAVRRGDFAAFDGEWMEFGRGLVKARALDSRIGCALLLSLMEERYPVNVRYCFTVQRESGFSGALGAAWRGAARAAIVLDAASADDLGRAENASADGACRLGGGAAIVLADGGAMADRGLCEEFTALARRLGIAVQTLCGRLPGSDAGAYQRGAGGARVMRLATPVRYAHTTSPVAAFSDIEAQYTLLQAWLERPEGDARNGGN